MILRGFATVLFLAVVVLSSQLVPAFGQVGSADSPFERNFQDIKFIDAYFGTKEKKLEVEPGDKNVPFTVVFSNVGSQDITGVKGQVALPMGFKPSDGRGEISFADSDTNAATGETFSLTFFVNVGEGTMIGEHMASVKVDYSRLRESGTRSSFFNFSFDLPGKSVITVRAQEPILTSLQENNVFVDITNDGSAPIAAARIDLLNTQTSIASTSQSITNVEKVVFLKNSWNLGNVGPKETKTFDIRVYVPEKLQGETLRAPLLITYFDSQGQQQSIEKIVDFFVKGFIDLTIYNIDVIELSEKPTVIGDIINEGNVDALFGFVTLEPIGDSNIKAKTQFIDEIETDSPVPFNMPIEFDGEAKYGEHDIKITVRYKDAVRDEHFENHTTTIFVPDFEVNKEPQDYSQLFIVPIVAAGIGIFVFSRIRKRKRE